MSISQRTYIYSKKLWLHGLFSFAIFLDISTACSEEVTEINEWEAAEDSAVINEFVQGVDLQTVPDVVLDTDSNPDTDPCKKVLVLTLDNSIKMALAAQRRLGSAWGAVTNAELKLEYAVSDFDWQINPTGDLGYVGGGPAGEGTTIGGGLNMTKKFTYGTRLVIQPTLMKAAKDYQHNVRVAITQPLLRGFGKEMTLAPVRSAQFGARNARRALYLAQVNLIIQTVQGLYEVTKQEELVKLDTESLERVKKFCTSTKMKERIGLCESLDVYRAETENKNAEDALSQSLERLQDAKDSLRDTLALSLDTPIEVKVPVKYTPIDIDLEKSIQIALTNRIEIDQAQDKLTEQRRLLRIEERNLWPDLNFTADYSSNAYDELFTSQWSNRRESKWGFGFTSAAAPDNGAYDSAVLALADAERDVEQARDSVILDVKRTLRGLERASDKIALQDEQIINARKEYHLSRVKFEHGMANNFDLIQAEKNLRSAQSALLGAVIEHKISEFRLLASLGMLAEKPGICR